MLLRLVKALLRLKIRRYYGVAAVIIFNYKINMVGIHGVNFVLADKSLFLSDRWQNFTFIMQGGQNVKDCHPRFLT